MANPQLEHLLDDSAWMEQILNSYAMFIGYISMAIKGLGYLVLTWTTVVLLGGFVSTLPMKDFWCLTFITLVQMAGIFDVTLNEKLSYLVGSVQGGMMATSFGVTSLLPRLPRIFMGYFLIAVQVVVLVVVLLPLATIYVFGIFMSGGISLWRLIQHDYRGDSGGEASNLIPAMDTLYYLALLQGVIFFYRFILGLAVNGLAKRVTTKGNHPEVDILYNYTQETKRGCQKEPSFADGRNLVTHAIDMIASSSPNDCIFGLRMLCAARNIANRNCMKAEAERESESDKYLLQRDILNGQQMLKKHLVMSSSASSRHIIQKLLEWLDSRGLHERNTRTQAAGIVQDLAFNINLEQFPGGIYHISSMIGTFEEYLIAEPYQRDYLFYDNEKSWDQHARCLPPSKCSNSSLWDKYKDLLRRGLYILQFLAAQEKNCRVMSDTPDLVSKIMALVTLDLIHNTTDAHGEWSEIVEISMKVMIELASAPGETGAKLRREISRCQGAISTLWRIINCNDCSEELQISAICIIKHLYLDIETSSKEDLVLKKESREDFVRMLVEIFAHDNKSILVREIAGKALWGLVCIRGGISDATIIIQTGGGDIIDSLTEMLENGINTKCSRAAAIILEHLCTHYTANDEYLGKLNKSIADLIPRVLEIIHSSVDETHTRKEPEINGFPKPETDVQNQCDGTRENNEQDQDEKELEAVMQSIGATNMLSSLLSLCGTVYDNFLSELAPDLAPQFHTPSFANSLEKIVVKHSDLNVENLSVLKSIGKMVIAMLKQSYRFVELEDLASLVEALSNASKTMQDFDLSMIFSSASRRETMTNLERRTLVSLVKEAKQSYARVRSTPVSG